MYIDKTTAAERRIISNTMFDKFDSIMRARRILMTVLGDHFEDIKQKEIDREDAEWIGDLLHTVNDLLWMVELEYSLLVGDEAAPSCKVYYEGAKTAAQVLEVERLRRALHFEDTKPYVNLSDEEALPILREIAKKKGVTIEAGG